MSPEAKKIAIFGCTGSIGRQALEVVEHFPRRLRAFCLTSQSNVSRLEQQCRKFRPEMVVTGSAERAKQLQDALGSWRTRILYGEEGLVEAAQSDGFELAVMAISGVAALRPTLELLRTGKYLALANKESLVAGGHLVMEAVRETNTKLVPVDSEHSAIYQLMRGLGREEVVGITLTASGGPFLRATRQELKEVTPEQALKHPTWNMGAKITIDSATLMNKGLEVMEARWLFDLNPSQIKVLIHPQSIVHSFVNLTDGVSLAHLGAPDMRIPIMYALLGCREQHPFQHLCLERCGVLSFEQPDLERFPCLRLAYLGAETGGTAPAVLNAANEEAVRLFINGRIGFTDIPIFIGEVLNKHGPINSPSLEEILQADKWARQRVLELLN